MQGEGDAVLHSITKPSGEHVLSFVGNSGVEMTAYIWAASHAISLDVVMGADVDAVPFVFEMVRPLPPLGRYLLPLGRDLYVILPTVGSRGTPKTHEP